MSFVKKIVCLANSFKTGGSCIAGREVLQTGAYGGWIRPVSGRPTAEISFQESWCTSNSSPRLLDVLEIHFLKAAPRGHQTENYEIDPSKRWVKQGVLPWSELGNLVEKPPTLWLNSDHTQSGLLNCVSHREAAKLIDSLVLIHRAHFTVNVSSSTWGGRTKKNYHGRFRYKGMNYGLKLTDPSVTNAAIFQNDGNYPLDNAYLCISLTEPWEIDNNRCHKLVASVITNPPL